MSFARPDESAAEQLLTSRVALAPLRMTARELRVEVGLAVAVLVAALLLAPGLPEQPLIAGSLVLLFALAGRVQLQVGAGSVVPTQLALIPMLFVTSPGLAPALVIAGLVLGTAPDVLARRTHPDRLVAAIGDAGHALGPALVLLLLGSPEPGLDALPVLALALLSQALVDTALSVGREWAGRGISPSVQLAVLAPAYGIDALLTPLGLLLAAGAAQEPVALVALLGLLILLQGVTRDRNRRLAQAIERGNALQRERARLREAIERTVRSFAASLDRQSVLDVALETSVDALEATGGVARASNAQAGLTPPAPAATRVLGQVERLTLDNGRPARAEHEGWWAIGRPLATAEGPGVIAVCRPGRPFGEDEEALLDNLARQASISIENADLHEVVRRQATLDELTGLANHRRFHEALEREVARSRRFGPALSLVLFDIDDFKHINDTHGHLVGDEVLRAVGAAVRHSCRSIDVPARYGGEELAVILPGTPLDGAYHVAETIRRRVAALLVDADGQPLRVTTSAGVAELGERGGQELIAAADAALYEAKRTGKNRTAGLSHHDEKEVAWHVASV